MLAKFRHSDFPTMSGSVLVDTFGVPRYWASVWASFLPADLAPSTIVRKLSQLEAFYQHADESQGLGALDDALADVDVDTICSALEGYFLALRGRPVTPATEERWQAALQFVTETVQRLSRGSLTLEHHHALSGRLMKIELLTAHLHVGRRRRPERIRSLPSEIVEALYEMLDPESSINPFRSAVSRWRVYTIFMLLLHQGLRRGELLNFPVDVIKSGFDRNRQQARYWMTVRYNEYQDDDPRYSKPSIKNVPSIRQIPVSKTTALLVQEYAMNYRGKPDHSFLINSQKQSPLSTEGVTKMFQKITASLPRQLRKVLIDHKGDDFISPHDLRHTCAVVRLNQLLSSGVEMTDALERMRVFFGWSRDSEMPLRYARAVFEDRLASVWNSTFDDRIEVLRSLSAGPK
jgi:integrase